MTALQFFSVRLEPATVSVTVRHSTVKVQPRTRATEEYAVTKPKVVFDPYSDEFYNNPFDIYDGCARTHRCITTRKKTSTR